ncbi:MAG: WD40/YVTN/BNR-like repeat-containing protein [Acidimicrobiales bacterium]
MLSTVLRRYLRYGSVAILGTMLSACGMMASSSSAPPTSQLNVATLTTAVNFGTSIQTAQFIGTQGPQGPFMFLTSPSTGANQRWVNSLELTSNFSNFVSMNLPKLSPHSLGSIATTIVPPLTIDDASFPTKTAGWVLATERSGNAVLLHTTDGGTTWSFQRSFATIGAKATLSVAFSSPSDGYVQIQPGTGGPATVYVTFNAGATFHALAYPKISSIVEMVGTETVVALAPIATDHNALGVIISHNGGLNFTAVDVIAPSSIGSPILLAQRVKNSSTVLLALGGTTPLKTHQIAIVSLTIDTGHSSVIASISTPARSGIPSMAFVSSKAWFVSYVGAGGAVTVRWTADSGDDWSTSVSTSLPAINPSKLTKVQPQVPPVSINYLSQKGQRRLLVTEAGLLANGGVSTTTYLLDATTIESIPPS